MRHIFPALILFLLVTVSCSRLPRENVWLYYPQNMATVGDSITVEGRAYDLDGVYSLSMKVINTATGSSASIPLERLASVYKGEIKEQLSKFRYRLDFPVEGDYRITVTMTDKSGAFMVSDPVRIRSVPGRPDTRFRLFSLSHFLPVAVLVFLNIAMVFFCRRVPAVSDCIPWIISSVLWGNEVVYHLWSFLLGSWSVTANLIIHMCGVSILFIPAMMLYPKEAVRRMLFSFLFFWGLGGAAQALLTPDIGVFGYPSYRYFSFFLSHGLIITSLVYMIAVRGHSLGFRDMIRSYLLTSVLIIPVYAINHMLRLLPPYEAGSYFFLLYPPVDGSAIDILVKLFGPSPRYIIGLLLLAFIVFSLLVFPFMVSSMRKKKTVKIPDDQAMVIPEQ